jgi:hypothetical protein
MMRHWYPGREETEQDEDVDYEQYLGRCLLRACRQCLQPEQIGTAISEEEQNEELGRRQQKIKKLQWAVDENDEEK